jgi:hypothetical protein
MLAAVHLAQAMNLKPQHPARLQGRPARQPYADSVQPTCTLNMHIPPQLTCSSAAACDSPATLSKSCT